MYMDHSAFLAVDVPVGGKIIPIDSTSLLLAGAQSSAVWMLSALAGVAGGTAFYLKTRKS